MKKTPLIILFLLTGLGLSNANAGVGKVSRSCRFDKIPAGQIQDIAASFLQKMGAPTDFANINTWSSYNQSFYWIHESVTTDYFSVRYYLFAKSITYVWDASGGYGPPSKWNAAKTYRSNWSVEQIVQRILTDPKFYPGYANRGPAPFYSARAGDPRILVKWVDPAKNNGPVDPSLFQVRGRHYYYDAGSGSQPDLGETTATDCNLLNWGIAIFDR